MAAPTQLIEGPAGALEVLHESPEQQQGDALVVICHPHSQYGGSLTNKVVHMLSKTALQLGLHSARFNFRGVGQSAGSFDHGLGEVADCRAVIHWVRQQHPTAGIWLAGFSFGSFVAFNTQRQLDVDNLLLVAPPVRMFEFGQRHSVTVPWQVLQGKQDEITDYQAVDHWARALPTPPALALLDDVDHFFTGKLPVLAHHAGAFWQQRLDGLA